MLAIPFNPLAFSIMGFVALIFAGCLVVFSVMKTTIEDRKLIARIGPVKKVFFLEGIISCRVTKVPWYYALESK